MLFQANLNKKNVSRSNIFRSDISIGINTDKKEGSKIGQI